MRVPGKWRTILSYVFIFGLLAAVNFLPPDTSLGEVRAAGVLRACVPTAYPPLVTGDDLIAAGHKPGPRFREILDAVEDAQLEGRLPSRHAALEFVRREFPLQ